MEQSNQSKKVLLSVIGVAILVVAVVGVSFAFFNYTQTGAQNSLKTGNIYFVAQETGDIVVTDFFPKATGAATDPTNSDSMTVTITGGTNYTNGIDYRLVAVNVSNNYNTVPVTVTTSTSDAGIGYTPNGTNGEVALAPDAVLGTGHIASSTNGGLEGNRTTGTITITAYLNGSDLAITDTPVESTDWVNGRTVISTSAWNALSSTPITFNVRVIADEGAATS